jgi:ATP-dependent Lon protease
MSKIEDQIQKMTGDVQNSTAPEELKNKLVQRLDQLSNLMNSPTFLPEFDQMDKYIAWILSLPWAGRTQDMLDLTHAAQILDKNHYGLQELKDRVLEYLAVMKLKQDSGKTGEIYRAPILCFTGLVGTGKTTIAASIAEAMGRSFVRIPFGGMGDPLELRGQSRLHAEAEPGRVIKALRQAQSKNCVVLLDEIDRVTDTGRASIMGVLVELLDPRQNKEFVDYYIDYPFDLSEVLFIATSNNTNNIATAVLDRLEPIQMPSYTDNEKIVIGKQYMLPRILSTSGLPDNSLIIDEDVWPAIVRPLGFDSGMRTLERTIEGVVRKAALQIVTGKATEFHVTGQNVKEYLS